MESYCVSNDISVCEGQDNEGQYHKVIELINTNIFIGC